MSIHSIYCDTQCIDSLKIVSMPVSLSCVLRYNNISMYHPISTKNQVCKAILWARVSLPISSDCLAIWPGIQKCDKATLCTSYPAFEIIEDINGLVLKCRHLLVYFLHALVQSNTYPVQKCNSCAWLKLQSLWTFSNVKRCSDYCWS